MQKEAKLYSAKFLNYFNYRNELATKHEQNRIYDLIMLATYYPLLILSVSFVPHKAAPSHKVRGCPAFILYDERRDERPLSPAHPLPASL